MVWCLFVLHVSSPWYHVSAALPAAGPTVYVLTAVVGVLLRRAVRRYQLQVELMSADPDYADHVAHTVNKWLAVTQFVVYNISVILIFTINTALYG
jgi:hypothetical protein